MNITIQKPFGDNDLNQSHELLNRLDKIGQDSVHNFAKNFLLAETVPDFTEIEIETCNRCNNDCPFCSVNRNNDTRKLKFMDEQLFYSIIDQLRAMNYRGTISLFSNNEPLLDGRILKFIEYARKNLPDATHCLYTNGILLTLEKFASLTKNLDHLIIDNYDDNFQLIPPIQKTLDEAKSFPTQYENNDCDVQIWLRKKNQKLNTRGSSAPNRLDESNKFRPKSICIYPFKQMIVRPDGTTAKCCNDPLTDMVTGDLNKQTVREVWRGKLYQDFRREMFFNGRGNFADCEFCDIFGLYLNYPPQSIYRNELRRLADEFALRKKLGAIYIFDTTDQSKIMFNRFKLMGVEFDGLVNFRNEPLDQNYNYVDLKTVLNNRDFMLITTPHYEDEFFDYFHAAGYQYRRDYLIYTYDVP